MSGLIANSSVVLAGLLAYAVAVVASAVLVFLTFRANLFVTRSQAEDLLLAGHRASAIAHGAVLLAQAVLLRHAVFPVMAVVRDLIVQHADTAHTLAVIGQCALFFVIIGLLSVASVVVATWLFTLLTGRIPEREEIRKDNVAVAIFFAFAVLAITLIVNEGMEDLSRSLIPYGASGVVRIK
jgi:uncharacterized membrane protein YjfL (UPF0719 family)